MRSSFFIDFFLFFICSVTHVDNECHCAIASLETIRDTEEVGPCIAKSGRLPQIDSDYRINLLCFWANTREIYAPAFDYQLIFDALLALQVADKWFLKSRLQ